MYFSYSDFKTEQSDPPDIENTVKRSPWKRWFSWKSFSGGLDEYCKEGSLHGLKYLRNPDLSRVERVFWIIIFSNAVYFSVGKTWQMYSDMMGNQVQMSYDPISTSIWDIPFPGIMICSSQPVRKSVFNLKTSSNQSEMMYYSKVVCPDKEYFGPDYNRPLDKKFFKFLSEAAIPCEQLFKSCLWNNKETDCCSIFKPTLSRRGQCYVFNTLPGEMLYTNFTPLVGPKTELHAEVQYWHISTGYPSRTGNDWKTVAPLWSERMGGPYGLTVNLLNHREDYQAQCSGTDSGFFVDVIPPGQPGESGSTVKLENGVHTLVKLEPSIIRAEEDLRLVPVEQRGCHFDDEGNLKYFKHWSNLGCFFDCLIPNLLSVCGCVPFDLHQVVGSFNYTYCSDEKMSCVFRTMERSSIVDETSDLMVCQCLPLCSSLNFDFQVSSFPLVTRETKPSWAKGDNKSLEPNIARMTVFFPQSVFDDTLTRVNTASFSAFMGNAGGLLGLLLGYSFMSGFEIFYFALIKPIVRVIIFYFKRNTVNVRY